MNTEMKTTHKATLWAWLLLAVLCCASPEATARKARTFSRPAWVGSTTYPYYEGGVCRHCYDYQFPRAIQAGLVDSNVQGFLASGR